MNIQDIFIAELAVSLIKDKCNITTKHDINMIHCDYQPNKYDELDKSFTLNDITIKYDKTFHIGNFVIFTTNESSIYIFRKQLH